MTGNRRSTSYRNAAKGTRSNSSLLPEKMSPLAFLLLLVPAVLALILSLFLKDSQADFLVWWMILFAFGAAAFPLAAWIFSAFTGSGYGFSKAIGILSVAFVVWTFAYIGFLPFNNLVILLFLLTLAGISWFVPATRKAAMKALSTKSGILHISFEESLFVIALFSWCLLKGIRPEINGEEKFMDFAFLNALVRTESLPAPDPWLAGSPINYYYFGQYIFAMITKMSALKTGVAYVLSMCTCFALAFTMSYSLGAQFIEGAIRNGIRGKNIFRIGAGLLSAVAVTIFGNSHAFYYYEKSIGNPILSFFASLGATVGRTDRFFYPDSTRFIGYNPESVILDTSMSVIQEGDMTIHEFPCYSYLLGDLHAHVISMICVLLIVGILFALYSRAKALAADSQGGDEFRFFSNNNFSLKNKLKSELIFLLQPETIAVGILLGIATMTNYWDFLIYFIVSCMVYLIYSIRVSRKFLTIPGAIFFANQIIAILVCYLRFSPYPAVHAGIQLFVFAMSVLGVVFLPCALTRTAMSMTFLFSVATLSSLTFNSKFEMIANALARTVNQTQPYQFFILWGTHLLFALVIIIVTILSATGYFSSKYPQINIKAENAISRFTARINPSDLFMSGLAVVSFLLLAAPEIFYVMDIYGGSYKRANTMFKFTFEAFILLSLIIGYTLFRIYSLRVRNRIHQGILYTLALALSVCIIIPATYPLVSIEQRTGPISPDAYVTLDGTKQLVLRDSPQLPGGGGDMIPYADAIEWFNANVQGNPVICEAYGLSYTDNCIVSAYTGLPTIVGWQTHEWLWHFQGIVDENGALVSNPQKPNVWDDILTPRNSDVANIYSSNDLSLITSTLAKYNVQYLIVGDLERVQYPLIDDELMKSLGSIAFESGTLYIVKIQ